MPKTPKPSPVPSEPGYLQRLVRRCWKRIIGDWWVVRRCGWPYPKGYATYNSFRDTILDTNLTKEHAQRICDELNEPQPNNPLEQRAKDAGQKP